MARLPTPHRDMSWFVWGEALVRAIQFSLNRIEQAVPGRSSLRIMPLIIQVPIGLGVAYTPAVAVPFRSILRANSPGRAYSQVAGTLDIMRYDGVTSGPVGTVSFGGPGPGTFTVAADAFLGDNSYVWLNNPGNITDFSVTLLLDRE